MCFANQNKNHQKSCWLRIQFIQPVCLNMSKTLIYYTLSCSIHYIVFDMAHHWPLHTWFVKGDSSHSLFSQNIPLLFGRRYWYSHWYTTKMTKKKTLYLLHQTIEQYNVHLAGMVILICLFNYVSITEEIKYECIIGMNK